MQMQNIFRVTMSKYVFVLAVTLRLLAQLFDSESAWFSCKHLHATKWHRCWP